MAAAGLLPSPDWRQALGGAVDVRFGEGSAPATRVAAAGRLLTAHAAWAHMSSNGAFDAGAGTAADVGSSERLMTSPEHDWVGSLAAAVAPALSRAAAAELAGFTYGCALLPHRPGGR